MQRVGGILVTVCTQVGDTLVSLALWDSRVSTDVRWGLLLGSLITSVQALLAALWCRMVPLTLPVLELGHKFGLHPGWGW